MSLNVFQNLIAATGGSTVPARSGYIATPSGISNLDTTPCYLSDWVNQQLGSVTKLEGRFRGYNSGLAALPNWQDFPFNMDIFTRGEGYSATLKREMLIGGYLPATQYTPRNTFGYSYVETFEMVLYMAYTTGFEAHQGILGQGATGAGIAGNVPSHFVWKRFFGTKFTESGNYAATSSGWRLQNPNGWIPIFNTSGYYLVEPQLCHQWRIADYNPAVVIHFHSSIAFSDCNDVLIVECKNPSVAGTPSIAGFGTLVWNKDYTCTVGKSFRLVIDMTGKDVTLVTAIEHD